ncbi:dTDP-4-amino-4,6-dideoxygalactose transaminase [Patiriisocius hiemis]|uniref:dTDP-4-amino-4,6-dideoxygalactose transaminase n=1 Tax=Patiriisocius hiemis TaxID=3075604 RepID=A0ABU2YE44_9FLAO|nr:dTDP-4-amino-4,6-dideoxygalactose transaminase [Constantimarinum sp. W242]MDT0556050.1 dTDP-4-amino-4,6-dideoxygalactose transaminase [Constantimarinum sp. W242]
MNPFNKPYLSGKELHYIEDAVKRGKLSGDGYYTKKCHDFFITNYGVKKVLLTTSCTDALEMASLLLDIKPGDEVIMPSYTFVSTANAFELRGATIKFVDSRKDHPGMDEQLIASLITPKTKAIVVVHYAGVACNMDVIKELANKHDLFVVEDAAQAIDSYYKGKPLGSIGHLGTFSFHETKNIQCGEGGLLMINDNRFVKRAEILWEKGTNRSAFFRGEIDKYGWVDVGSSFLPSELNAAYLFAQLESLKNIQEQRKNLWQHYFESLTEWTKANQIQLPFVPNFATNNGHMFYLICKNSEQRAQLIAYLKNQNILSVFHYISLHSSPYFLNKHDGRILPMSEVYTDRLLRLPMYYELDVNHVINVLLSYGE